MAELTVDGLGELTSPAANDEIGIWDVSAGQYLKIRRDTLVGGTITGGGTVATGGFTLTVPATGTAALRGADNNFSAAQTMQAGIGVGVAGALLARPMQGVIRQKLENVTIADSGTLTISADATARGLFLLYDASEGNVAVGVAQGATVTLLYGGASFATTADNAGTMNIYTSGNNIIVQNKRGGSRVIQVWLVL